MTINVSAEERIEPAPEREKKRTWKQFLKSHWDTLYACDFFSVEALIPFGTVRYMVFFIVEIKTRAVEIAGIAVDPGQSVKTPPQSHNCNPHAEWFIKTIKYECLNHFVIFGERANWGTS